VKSVRVTIADLDGTVIESFVLCHWHSDDEDEDSESYGSTASESLLLHRITRHAKT